MPLLRPDPTFYPSPTMAMQSPQETLAYVALVNSLNDGRADAIGVVDVDPDVEPATAASSVRRICLTPATSSIISVGTRAVPASVRTRRIRTWNGDIWWCRASTRRAFTFSIRSRIRSSRRS